MKQQLILVSLTPGLIISSRCICVQCVDTYINMTLWTPWYRKHIEITIHLCLTHTLVGRPCNIFCLRMASYFIVELFYQGKRLHLLVQCISIMKVVSLSFVRVEYTLYASVTMSLNYCCWLKYLHCLRAP